MKLLSYLFIILIVFPSTAQHSREDMGHNSVWWSGGIERGNDFPTPYGSLKDSPWDIFRSQSGSWPHVSATAPDNRQLSHQLYSPLQAIIEDFRVNELAGPSVADQGNPAVAVDASGNFVVVWHDERNGNWDIYAQRYTADGTPIGSNFRVDDDNKNENQEYPAVAVDAAGNFVVVWQDTRNRNLDIYAQRYSADGTPIGSNFKVNDDQYRTRQGYPAVAVDAAGNFVVVWQDTRNRNLDIYAQRYSANGTPIGSNFKVNDDQGSAGQMFPAVAMDASGNFVVVWHDIRNGNWDIYAQRYAADGTPIGNNFQVNDDSGRVVSVYPAVAMDNAGNFVVVWTDILNEGWDIYAQRYAADGTPIGNKFKVNGNVGSASQWAHPGVTMDNAGDFVIVWHNEHSEDSDIYAQRYTSAGTPIGSNVKVNDDTISARQEYPNVVMGGNGNFIVVWVDERNENLDIYAQRYTLNGSPIGNNFQVNDDKGTWQVRPAVAVNAVGNFVVVWQDERDNFKRYIYFQRYAADGTPIGSNFKVNDDQDRERQGYPAVVVDAAGNFVVVWTDSRIGDRNIYAQRYAADGLPIGSNFQVNDDSGSVWTASPAAVAMDNAGNFVVVWTDDRNGNLDIYAQLYAADGTPIGTNFKVNDDPASAWQGYPAVAMDSAGNFVVVWEDDRDSWKGDIYAQRYAASGTPIGKNFKINDDQGRARQGYPAVAVDATGNFVVVWYDERNRNGDIYSQRYAADGTPIGKNFKINDDQGSAGQGNPAVSVNDAGNVIVVWEDWRNGNSDIYAQRYSADGTPLGNNFIVTKNRYNSQIQPDIILWNGRIYTVWASNHVIRNGYDIWANVLDWNDPYTSIAEDSPAALNTYYLAPNYPNPFNPGTTIRYHLPRASRVMLQVYNPLGQVVRTLVEAQQPAGRYTVQWDGRDTSGRQLPAGVYFYRLKAGQFEQVRKMVLVR